MRPLLQSVGDYTDVDGSVYEAVFAEAGGFFTLPPVSRDFTDVSFFEPVPGDKTQDPWEFDVWFFPVATTDLGVRQGLQVLRGRFRPQDSRGSMTLVVADADDSNKEWQVPVVVIEQPETVGSGLRIKFQADKPYLTAVDPESVTFTITVNGDTDVVNNPGTLPAYPVLTASPTAVKGGGFVTRKYAQLLNGTDILFPGAFGFDLSEITPGTASFDTAVLISDTTKSNQINVGGGINASATSIPVDTPVGGGLNTGGGVCYVGTEQIRYTNISAGTMSVASGGRGWGGTTAASHADNAVITQSYILANGEDIRVFFNGTEIDRWLTNLNTSATKLWVVVPGLQPRVELPLRVALAAGGTTEISLTVGKKDKAKFDRFANSGEVMIGTDRFSYSGKDAAAFKLLNVQQGIKDTTAAVHNVGATVKQLQYDVVIAYGNPDIATLDTDDTKMPAFNLSSSTNLLHVYDTQFNGSALKMADGWIPSIVQNVAGLSADFYTADHDTVDDAEADPFTVMGSRIDAYESAGKWLAGTGGVVWALSCPQVVDEITWTGQKYRVSTKWPKIAAAQKSPDGKKYTTVVNEATPASAETWGALTTHSNVNFDSPNVRFFFSGSGNAVPDDTYELQVETVSVEITSANVPSIAVGAGTSIYEVDGVLTNEENDKQLYVKFIMDFNEDLEIDTELQTATYLKTNEPVYYAVQPGEPTYEWFALEPGDNTVRWDEVGVTGFSVTFDFYPRSTP